MRTRVSLFAAALAFLSATSGGLAQQMPPMQLLPFFFTVEMDLQDDGSGTMALTYPATPATNFDTEHRRFASATTRATDVKIREGMTFTTVAFADVTRLSDVGDLSSVTAERRTEKDGTRLVNARLRSPFLGDLPSDEKVTIRVTLPGPVTSSNAQESSGRSAVWKAPVQQFFREEGIVIRVSYKPQKEEKVS